MENIQQLTQKYYEETDFFKAREIKARIETLQELVDEIQGTNKTIE